MEHRAEVRLRTTLTAISLLGLLARTSLGLVSVHTGDFIVCLTSSQQKVQGSQKPGGKLSQDPLFVQYYCSLLAEDRVPS